LRCISGGNSHRKGITRGKHLRQRIDSESWRKLLRGFWVGAGKAAKVAILPGIVAVCTAAKLRRSVPDALK